MVFFVGIFEVFFSFFLLLFRTIGVSEGGECGPPRGERGASSRHGVTVPREASEPGDLALPQISALAPPPSPAYEPNEQQELGAQGVCSGVLRRRRRLRLLLRPLAEESLHNFVARPANLDTVIHTIPGGQRRARPRAQDGARLLEQLRAAAAHHPPGAAGRRAGPRDLRLGRRGPRALKP